MKTTTCAAVLLGLLVLALPARAGQGEGGRPHGNLPPEMKKEILARFDKNGDGKLDEAERQAAKEALKERFGQRLQGMKEKLLAKFDKDGDGKLSPEERQAAREYAKEHIGELAPQVIQRFDKNGDGKLDEAERQAAKEALHQRLQGHGGPGKLFNQGGAPGPDGDGVRF